MNTNKVMMIILSIASLLSGLSIVYITVKRTSPEGVELQKKELDLEKANIELQKEKEKTKQMRYGGVKNTTPQNALPSNAVRPTLGESIANGSTFAMTPNKKITLTGPTELVLTDGSARLIKAWSGAFKLHVENSNNWSWTSSYSSDPPPMDMKTFLDTFKRLGRNANVRIFVEQGTVAEIES